MRLSLLDRSRTRAGHEDAAALHDTVSRARHAESLGFHRFWVAEHHAVPGIASGSPAVLLASIGQVTRRIRLGSGGVMLPQHQPLVVAEQFRMLEALHPGRVDLGVGRSLGFTPPVRRALRRDAVDTEAFEADVDELRAYLDHTGGVTVRPAAGRTPLFLLATGDGVAVAARLGLPLVVGGPLVLGTGLPEVLAGYRRDFSPSVSPSGATAPEIILSLDVFVAQDERRARELALPEAWALARSRQTGEFGPLEAPERILAQHWSDRLRGRVGSQLERVVAGSPTQVADRLQALADATGADEVIASTSTYHRADLRALDEALARVGESL